MTSQEAKTLKTIIAVFTITAIVLSGAVYLIGCINANKLLCTENKIKIEGLQHQLDRIEENQRIFMMEFGMKPMKK